MSSSKSTRSINVSVKVSNPVLLSAQCHTTLDTVAVAIGSGQVSDKPPSLKRVTPFGSVLLTTRQALGVVHG
jgi:hypothetical protein